MRTARIAVGLAVVILATSTVLAAPKNEGKKEKKAPPCPAAQRAEKMLEGVTLTDEQKTKLQALNAEYGPKLTEALKTADVLTPEQKKVRAEVMKDAKASGKKGKELAAEIEAKVKLTDDQKAKQAEAKKAVASLEKEFLAKVAELLTDEQKAQLKKPEKKKAGK